MESLREKAFRLRTKYDIDFRVLRLSAVQFVRRYSRVFSAIDEVVVGAESSDDDSADEDRSVTEDYSANDSSAEDNSEAFHLAKKARLAEDDEEVQMYMDLLDNRARLDGLVHYSTNDPKQRTADRWDSTCRPEYHRQDHYFVDTTILYNAVIDRPFDCNLNLGMKIMTNGLETIRTERRLEGVRVFIYLFASIITDNMTITTITGVPCGRKDQNIRPRNSGY